MYMFPDVGFCGGVEAVIIAMETGGRLPCSRPRLFERRLSFVGSVCCPRKRNTFTMLVNEVKRKAAHLNGTCIGQLHMPLRTSVAIR